MKTIWILPLALASVFAFADESKVDAPKEVVQAALKTCKQYAYEDQIPDDERKNYLFNCVNDELDEQGYKMLATLELDEDEELV